jgi:O-methyltransferase
MQLGQLVNRIAGRFGLRIARLASDEPAAWPDVPADFAETWAAVRHYTMTSPERVIALCEATRYVQENAIAGSVVECGVWKGGSMMAVARTLLKAGDASRDLYLFDTFEGMAPPSPHDVDVGGRAAEVLLRTSDQAQSDSVWCRAGLDEVKEAVGSTGYPADKVHYVKGRVEATIPGAAPERIALLRLDTDWYESTRHELEHLFPRLVAGGVLIIDDYGHWKGARKAVDEYLRQHGVKLLLNRIDYTGRIAVKVG